MFQLIVEGNLMADCEVRHLPSGSQVLSFLVSARLAKKKAEGEQYPPSQVVKVSVFGDQQINFLSSKLVKGAGVLAIGDAEVRTWEKNNGETAISVDMKGSTVQITRYKDTEEAAAEAYTAKRPTSKASSKAPVGDDDIPF